jgi:hypothetical protein
MLSARRRACVCSCRPHRPCITTLSEMNCGWRRSTARAFLVEVCTHGMLIDGWQVSTARALCGICRVLFGIHGRCAGCCASRKVARLQAPKNLQGCPAGSLAGNLDGAGCFLPPSGSLSTPRCGIDGGENVLCWHVSMMRYRATTAYRVDAAIAVPECTAEECVRRTDCVDKDDGIGGQTRTQCAYLGAHHGCLLS